MKKTVSLVLALLLVVSLCACTEADQVNHNINQAADNFNESAPVYTLDGEKLVFDHFERAGALHQEGVY